MKREEGRGKIKGEKWKGKDGKGKREGKKGRRKMGREKGDVFTSFAALGRLFFNRTTALVSKQSRSIRHLA